LPPTAIKYCATSTVLGRILSSLLIWLHSSCVARPCQATAPRLTESIPPASQRAPGAASGGLAEGFAEVMMRAVQAKAGEEGLAPVAEWLGQLLAHVTSVQATGKPAKDAKGAASAVLVAELGERFDSLETRADGLRDEGTVLAARLDESTTVLQEVWQAAATELRSEIRSTRSWAEGALAEQAAKAAAKEQKQGGIQKKNAKDGLKKAARPGSKPS
jgi:hypothetical protein